MTSPIPVSGAVPQLQETDEDHAIRNLRKLDARRRVNTAEINAEMRKTIAVAMVQCCEQLQITRGTLFLAMKMLDFIISGSEQPTLLDGAAALLLALKMEEFGRTDIAKELGEIFTLEQESIIAHEVKAFQKLEFDSYFATPADFLWHMLQRESRDVTHYANSIVMAACMSADCSQYLSEDVANACILIARECAAGKQLNEIIIEGDQCALTVLLAAKLQQSGDSH